MKLTFHPTELKNAMAIVSKAIAPKSSLPILAFELQKEYFDMAEKRIKDERRQLTLF